jgi:hypothetical protein
MAHPVSKSPKIALIYDHLHSDPNEQSITERLSKVNPKKKIVFFAENRCIESESLNQYSVELLSKDKNISTANPCMLLIAHVLAGLNKDALKPILSTIYTDPYLKKLFIEKHFEKYDPSNYELTKSINWKKLTEATLTERQKMAINNATGLFKMLDEELPKQASYLEKEEFFEGHMTAATDAMTTTRTDLFDASIFAPISEALAFIKIKQVNEKLGSMVDPSKELSVSMINRFHGTPETLVELLKELNHKYRTQFQAQKVIKTVEKILKASNTDPDTIFVVRVGLFHREIMNTQLKEHFTNRDIREVSLLGEDLTDVEQKIRDKFVLD